MGCMLIIAALTANIFHETMRPVIKQYTPSFDFPDSVFFFDPVIALFFKVSFNTTSVNKAANIVNGSH
jgi:hypothetical protein